MAWTQKTEFLLGAERVQQYAASHVLVVGVGGVGAFVAEFLARAGVGALTLVDGDVVSETNRNRQLLALCSTDAQVKVEVLAARLHDINPEIQVFAKQCWLNEENIPGLLETSYDFVVDAIDDVPAKVALLKTCVQRDLRVVSAMGAAGKYDPSLIQQADISKSYHCGLAKAVRKRLSQQEGIKSGIPVVFSPEPTDLTQHPGNNGERVVPGTMPYMPAAFACHLAAYVLKQL